jgi:hypothetical protein
MRSTGNLMPSACLYETRVCNPRSQTMTSPVGKARRRAIRFVLRFGEIAALKVDECSSTLLSGRGNGRYHRSRQRPLPGNLAVTAHDRWPDLRPSPRRTTTRAAGLYLPNNRSSA